MSNAEQRFLNHTQRYMKLSSDMPQLIDSNWNRSSNFDSINAAIAYLSASEEVKEEVNASSEPVTEKLIKQLKVELEKTSHSGGEGNVE